MRESLQLLSAMGLGRGGGTGTRPHEEQTPPVLPCTVPTHPSPVCLLPDHSSGSAGSEEKWKLCFF